MHADAFKQVVVYVLLCITYNCTSVYNYVINNNYNVCICVSIIYVYVYNICVYVNKSNGLFHVLVLKKFHEIWSAGDSIYMLSNYSVPH